jgi:hypothetical protein
MRAAVTVAVVVCGLAAATPGAAAPPAGFVETVRLEPAASFVARRPVVVNCATTHEVWLAYAASFGFNGDSVGITIPGSSETALSDAMCRSLQVVNRTRAPRLYPLAAAVETLVHESIHMRGERDEGVTDCAAMHEMPRVAVRFFRVRPGRQLRALMANAWQIHAAKPAPYRTVC